MLEERVGRLRRQSSIYVTEAVGFQSESYFFNAALSLITPLSPEDLLLRLKAIEKELGRECEPVSRDKGGQRVYQDRPIDLDIIFYDELVYHSPSLDIPHKAYRERAFVLLPLLEIAAEHKDPITEETVREIWQQCLT